MKVLKFLSVLAVGAILTLQYSCNGRAEFPDYEGGTAVYFANQYPVRTIVLGEDVYDTTADNEHRFSIYATLSGVYSNKKKVTIDVQVDNSLTDNLYYDAEGTIPVVAMPTGHYSTASNQIVIDKRIQGAVGIQLNDAFFADPKALETTYVVPLVMNQVQNADSILSGKLLGERVSRTNKDGWDIQPKDFVLYAVKFINPWDANYLRRGTDVITTAEGTRTVERPVRVGDGKEDPGIEKDEVISLTSAGLTQIIMPLQATDSEGSAIPYELLLTFTGGLDGGDATCTITSNTPGVTASGTGTWKINGKPKAWGNKDRNLLSLDYSVDLGSQQYQTVDELVFRDRGIKPEFFTPTYITPSNR